MHVARTTISIAIARTTAITLLQGANTLTVAYGDWTHCLLASVSSPPPSSSLFLTLVWWL